MRRELLVGVSSFALALSACGDKAEPIGGSDDGGATSTATSSATSSSTASSGTTSHTNVSPSATVSPDTSEPAADGGEESQNETTPEAGSTTSECGGDGQACCARATCDDGLVCIDEPSSDDAGIVVFDGGSNNQAFFDGGRFDAAVIAPLPGVDAAAELDAGSEPSGPPGVCAPCGGVDERCCAQNSCDDGLSCEETGFGPNAPRSCVDDGCGAVGQNCCPSNGGGFGGGGGGGECDEGLTCNDLAGDRLDNSECTPTSAGDAGEREAGDEPISESDAASEECGGLDQACCPGMGGQCNDGLQCDRRPPQGLEGNVCIED